MNRIASIIAVTALLLAPISSLAAEKAAEKPAEKAPPAAKADPALKPEAEKLAVAAKEPVKRGPSRAHEDARVCLEQATNREVAICAEKFR